ncbi:hypothetical protein B0I37DRAFT_196322 [Chaetomium sp. MPI-CAGE-AT-0009]|nr:hypothetical protein B0I37DRAFT_196322 [Chaetomium sp. MPI-CAGE-AT-0009]
MTTPSINITLQPFEAGKAEYLPLGAKSAGAPRSSKIVFRLNLRNTGASLTKVTGIKFAFPGSIHATFVMQDINLDGALDIAAGATAYWSNGITVNKKNNAVYLDGAAPTQIRIEIAAQGFANPATVTYPLQPHKAPVAGDAYRFIFSTADLRDGEYVETSAVHWANGGAGGTQIFAHDLGVTGLSSGSWSQILPGVDGKLNSHWRIYDKPVRAAADGVVMEFLDTMDENTRIGQFPDPAPNPGTGNNILVRHGTEAIRYCHFRKGSIPAALKTIGAPVLAGQELGRAGNSGNSTNPHTHIQTQRISDWALRPLPFSSVSVLPQTLIPSSAPATGPWSKLTRQGIPKDTVAIWPSTLTDPGFRSPAAGFSISGSHTSKLILAPNLASFSFMAGDLHDAGLRLVCVTSYLEGGTTRKWAGVARTGAWDADWWISNSLASFRDKAQDLFDSEGKRLIWMRTFVEGGVRKFVGIARQGTWASRFFWRENLSDFTAEVSRLDREEGKKVVGVVTWMEGTARRWFGITSGGGMAETKWWVSHRGLGEFKAEVQRLFDDEGKRLVYFTTFVEGGVRKWVGIARAESWGHRFYNRSDLDLWKLQADQYLEHQGLRVEQIEFFE